VTSSDAARPPGGPPREDAPEGDLPSDDDDLEQSDEDAELQQENAGTSLDQPSS